MWMPSLDLATGLWARMRRTLYTLFSRLSRAAQRFWMSRAYFPVLLTMSAAFMAAGEPVYGAAALGCIVIWLLAACPDLLAPVCPFFMAFLMSTQCYGQLSDFLPCAALVPLLVLALLWHFAVWPVTLRIGRSGLGLALVSIAALLGGCAIVHECCAVCLLCHSVYINSQSSSGKFHTKTFVHGLSPFLYLFSIYSQKAPKLLLCTQKFVYTAAASGYAFQKISKTEKTKGWR